ncbi:ATPase [Purpureocillium lavendulum]|uniref:ATPase n=1 Tax=Purpureocillium lavendulum TaxID=1247861 RepID=A0AB34FXZ4_9HYPO|nr:ATPase [Purpureocillium lavendulum]
MGSFGKREVDNGVVTVGDDSSDSVLSIRSRSRPRPRRSASPEPSWSAFACHDGKVPDVVYSIKRFGKFNRLIERRVSDEPYEHRDMTDDVDSSYDGNKPVLEILTKTYSYHRSRTTRTGLPPPPPRPSRYEPNRRYRSRSVSSESEYDSDDGGAEDGVVDVRTPTMIVHSEHLTNALQAVIAYYPSVYLSSPPRFKAPYRALYHHRRELAEFRDNQPSCHDAEYAATTAQHIDVLLRFLQGNLGDALTQEEERHALDPPLATHEYFWLLLKPGTVFYTKKHGIWTAYVLSSFSAPRGLDDTYRVTGWFLESNGQRIERVFEDFTVSRWQGEQPISSLSLVPEPYWADDLEAQGGLTMREKQIKEGKLAWELLKRPTYMQYDGELIGAWPGEEGLRADQTGFMKGRVICDDAGFNKYWDFATERGSRTRSPYRARGHPRPPEGPVRDHLPTSLPRCGCRACAQSRSREGVASPYRGFEGLRPNKDSPPDNDLFYLICSKAIPGFVLGTRRWGNLYAGNLKAVVTDKEAFKYLVVDDDIKRTVKALIGQFASSVDANTLTPWGNDFVRNKGEGRIFLLHGQPGVGKTCTAECIAEQSNRPLIALTSGDVGSAMSPHHIERRLNYFLELGQRYGALVLIDEADVYLERRRASDLSRNGLVSVFLRALEYYRGVLVLTTNRVRAFDSAFLSRIHVALHYKNLTDEHRERIWAHNFDRLGRDSAGRVRVSEAARAYVSRDLEVRRMACNGREIRNAMQTALALAESDARDEGVVVESGVGVVTVCERHLRAVLDMSRSFKDYTAKCMGNVASFGEQAEYEGSEHGPATNTIPEVYYSSDDEP